MKHVIKRVVCKGADQTEVTEWCRRILGGEGWGTSIQINDGRPYQADPVILLYNTLERPIEQIELMIALRWS
jgi:hypothetical protein